jgi:hypothetical protein
VHLDRRIRFAISSLEAGGPGLAAAIALVREMISVRFVVMKSWSMIPPVLGDLPFEREIAPAPPRELRAPALRTA